MAQARDSRAVDGLALHRRARHLAGSERAVAALRPLSARVAERPSGEQLSVTMANRLADMHKVAPGLTEAVARRITSSDLHEKAQRDLGGFVHRTVIEDERTYAVRIDDGALLDAAEQIEHARAHLAPANRQQLAGILGVESDKLDSSGMTSAPG
jgi:hypothetical protein